MKQKRKFKLNSNDIMGYLFLLPAIFVTWIAILKPTLQGTVMSFFNMKGYKLQGFCGFDNYITVMRDPQFVTIVGNSFKYLVWSLIIGFLIPILLAILLNELTHLRKTLRFLVYSPSAIPATATALLWYFIYYPSAGGLLNTILSNFGMPISGWLQNPKMTIICIIISMTWSGAGGTMMYYFAGLQGISREMYEAAIIDGAGVIRRARTITLPNLYPLIILFLAKQVIAVFSIMEQPMQMTGGGPNGASNTIALQIYNYAFVDYRPQLAMALGVILFIILIIMTCFYFKLDKKVQEGI